MTLDDAQSLDQALSGIASTVPPDLKQAVAAYVAMRKNRLRAEISQSSFRAEETRLRLVALDELLSLLDLDGKAPTPDLRPERGVAQDEHLAWLADVLTPPGWDQEGGILEVVSEWENEADEALMKGENDAARAKKQEAVWIARFLRNTARKGNGAREVLRANAGRVVEVMRAG